MHWKPNFIQFALMLISHGVKSQNISWDSCDVDAPPAVPIECGNVTVPLDYTAVDKDKTLDLQLLKVPALHRPKKGSILFNFGGPGLEARLTLTGSAEILLALTGGHYDLIAHDPRGTANTLTASCANSQEEREAMTQSISFATPSDEMELGKLWAGTGVFSNACYNSDYMREAGTLMSTAFSARDLMQIVDSLDEDGMLRYWGLSYGTVLGSTVAAMFPDQMDKVILDAVMNPHEYYHAFDREMWADSDKVFSSFFTQCLKSPDSCLLSTLNMTSFDLEKATYNLLDDLKREPLVHNQTIIDHTLVKTFIRATLYSPPAYPNLAHALHALLGGDTATFLKHWELQMGEPGIFTGGIPDESPFAIPCSEKKTGKTTLHELIPDFRGLVQESRVLGDVGIGLAMTCSRWKIEAKERYDGNFEVKTKHPMLIIGNTYDSATPLRSARNISASFDGSVLLEHGGWGHATLAHGSSCTSRAIRNYWTDGTLPEVGKVCEPDYPPFEKGSLQEVLVKIGFMSERSE